MKTELINPQPTVENPVIVENYPYGFRLKTKARYYIETTKNGQRSVFQTLNPKTQKWNAPKKSTYSEIMLLIRNLENNHVENDSFSITYSDQEDLNAFLAKYPINILSDYQQKQIKLAQAIIKARKHIKLSIVTNPSQEKQAEIELHEEEARKIIPSLVNYYLKNPEGAL